MGFDLSDYVDVKTRIQEFHKLYPSGSIQFEFKGLMPGRDDMMWGVATAWRTPDEVHPTTGVAAELINGKTGFTRNSELMNLETSAIGRAIGNLGIGIEAGMATSDEVAFAKERQRVIPSAEQDPWAEEQSGQVEAALTAMGATPYCACGMEMIRKDGTNPATGKSFAGWVCRQHIKGHNLWDK